MRRVHSHRRLETIYFAGDTSKFGNGGACARQLDYAFLPATAFSTWDLMRPRMRRNYSNCADHPMPYVAGKLWSERKARKFKFRERL